MAWNPSPEIAALREISKRFDRPIVVAFAIERCGCRFSITTYGETKALCKAAGAFGDELANAVAEGRIAAPGIEPASAIAAQAWERVDALFTDGRWQGETEQTRLLREARDEIECPSHPDEREKLIARIDAEIGGRHD